jgi:F-type H+-transporting ATPase subunit b
VIRRLTLAAMLLLVATFAFAQSNQPDTVAHGAEKAAHEVVHPNEDHGEHGEAPKTYFGIPGWILKLLNMIVFLAVLGYFLRGPVTTALAQRHEQILSDAAEARERRTKADQMAADIQTRLTQIEQEVRSIAERAEADGQRQRQELMAAAEAEAAKILQSARNEVENRLKSARHELTEYAGQLASDRAMAILKEKITDADQRKLFEESLREVGEAKA